jgi:hypothetical protein
LRMITDREASDIMFIRRLAKKHREQDKELFFALHRARDAFSEAVEDQEQIYFNDSPKIQWDGTGTPWPQGAKVIKVPYNKLTPDETFDNEMTICIDGVEIIRAYSSLDPLDTSRKNRLASESGPAMMIEHKNFLTKLFTTAGASQFHKKDLERLFDILPDFELALQWMDSPELIS